MTLNLQTRAGSLVDEKIDAFVGLLDQERYKEARDFLLKEDIPLPLINHSVYYYLTKLRNGDNEKRGRIIDFGKEQSYQWHLWRFG